MRRLTSLLVSRGLRRGLLGGEPLWLVLGGLGLVLRLARRAGRKRREVVFAEEVPLGGSLVITHVPRRGHNGRREGPAS